MLIPQIIASILFSEKLFSEKLFLINLERHFISLDPQIKGLAFKTQKTVTKNKKVSKLHMGD